MKKIKLYLSILMSIIYIVSFSQERVTKEKPLIDSKIIGKLDSATGWILNPVENWISGKNTIPVYLDPEFNVLLNYERNGLGIDNFIYYQLREVIYENKSYYVLIKKFKSGFYTYPNIEKGWNTFNSYNAYVFNKNEILKFDTLESGKPSSISINLIDNIYVEMKSDKEAISLFESKMKFDSNEKNYLHFEIAMYNDKNIVQFQIYTEYTTYDMFLEKRDPFKYCYFETSMTSFKNFLFQK
ncbi:hypothetical protein PG910_07045 [Tenacibaculum dicentrarchi]|nr:hypothetical protein PG910_07045 [Tenacibaculum dicentrarchi]